MKIESKGSSPYKANTSETKIEFGGSSQSSNASTFIDALEIIFDLTNAGLDGFDSKKHITPVSITDSSGEIVFSMDNPSDVELLRKIDNASITFGEIRTISEE